jgi:hypothetical protein
MNADTESNLSTAPAVLELAAIQRSLGIPDGDFARSVKLPYSGSSWGKIKAGTFSGANEKALRAIKSTLALYRTGDELEIRHGLVIFPHVRQVLDAVEIARVAKDEHKLVVVAGPQGSGKTAIAKLLKKEHGGHCLNSHPSCQRSYMTALRNLASGIGLVPNFTSAGEAESSIFSALKSSPAHIGLDEANYFSRDFIGFLKAVLNETASCLSVFLLPNQLARMAAVHSEESKQFLRRAVAIVHIPAVSSAEVMAIHSALYSHLLLGDNAPKIASAAGRTNHIDSVIEIFEEADPEDPSDIKSAIDRVENARRAVLQTKSPS